MNKKVLWVFKWRGKFLMSKAHERIEKAFEFFCSAEKSKHPFTLDEVCAFTGWKIQTVRSYRSKKWYWFLEEDQDKFYAKGICEYPKKSFVRIHAQRTDNDTRNLRPRFSKKVDDLVDKARESALLAVQTYNNPLTVFRTPAYLILMNIALTALFHAIFERDAIECYYKKSDGTPERIIDGEPASWELLKCANYYYQGRNTAERANITFLVELRNKIEHRFLPQLDANVAAHCQAMLLNFEDLLRSEFGAFFAIGQSLALSLQFTEIASHQRETIKQFQANVYDSIRKDIDSFQLNLPDDILQSQKYAFRVFLIPRLGNHASSSDAAIEFIHFDITKPEEMKQYDRTVAMVKEKIVSVQVANQGKLKPSVVVRRVKEATGKPFSINTHASAWKLYNVRPKKLGPQGCNPEFCHYDEAHQDFVYTEKWVQFLITKVNDAQELLNIKKYKDTDK